ncbi:ATP-dependent helicase [Vibrio fluvialis]|nr:ATP-dependent helicase [Vibrio fluvialis]
MATTPLQTPQQREAIQHRDSPLLLTAGAGAGKTSVIVSRIESLVASGYNLCQIAAISFTRESSAEINRRVVSKVGGTKDNAVWVSTLHRFAIEHILKPNWDNAFFSQLNISRQPFKILVSRYKQNNFLKISIAQYLADKQLVDLQEIVGEKGVYNAFFSWVGLVRAYGHTPASYFAQMQSPYKDISSLNAASDVICIDDANNLLTKRGERSNRSMQQAMFHYFVKLWLGYEELICDAGFVDSDQVLVLAMLYLEHSKEARLRLRAQFPIFMVDEFQDLNLCQFRLTLACIGKGQGFSGCGDLKQAIYNFRGSSCGLMPKITALFPEAKHVHLPDNFRSTKPIVAAANRLCETMSTAFDTVPMVGHKESPQLPSVVSFASTIHEANWLVDKILNLKKDGIKGDDIGILYRNKSHCKEVENALLNRQVEFEHLANETGLYDEDEVRHIVTFLHLLCAPYSANVLPSLFSLFPSVKWNPTEYSEILKGLTINESTQTVSAHSFLTRLTPTNCPPQVYRVAQELIQMAMPVSDRVSRVRTFDSFLQYLSPEYFHATEAEKKRAWKEAQQDLIKNLTQLFLKNFWPLVRAKTMGKGVVEQLSRSYGLFFNDIFSALPQSDLPFDEYVATRPIKAKNYGTSKPESPNAVKLMTCHGSKGLEKRIVFIVGCTDDQWVKDIALHEQYILSVHASDTHAENHRLFYVSVTRAIDQLWMSYPRQRKILNSVIETEPLTFLALFGDSVNYLHSSQGELQMCDSFAHLVAVGQGKEQANPIHS